MQSDLFSRSYNFIYSDRKRAKLFHELKKTFIIINQTRRKIEIDKYFFSYTFQLYEYTGLWGCMVYIYMADICVISVGGFCFLWSRSTRDSGASGSLCLSAEQGVEGACNFMQFKLNCTRIRRKTNETLEKIKFIRSLNNILKQSSKIEFCRLLL